MNYPSCYRTSCCFHGQNSRQGDNILCVSYCLEIIKSLPLWFDLLRRDRSIPTCFQRINLISEGAACLWINWASVKDCINWYLENSYWKTNLAKLLVVINSFDRVWKCTILKFLSNALACSALSNEQTRPHREQIRMFKPLDWRSLLILDAIPTLSKISNTS